LFDGSLGQRCGQPGFGQNDGNNNEKCAAHWTEANDQLTDGGPPLAPESPNGSSGPPCGGAFGSARRPHF
jgi:hypothetical protein